MLVAPDGHAELARKLQLERRCRQIAVAGTEMMARIAMRSE